MNRLLWIPALGACAGLLCGQAPQAAQNRGFLPPEIGPGGRVTFRLAAPKTAEVILNGDWDSGSNAAMQKDDRGVWTATVGPLAPELWSYSFTVDGVRMLDPANVDSTGMAAGYRTYSSFPARSRRSTRMTPRLPTARCIRVGTRPQR